MPRVLQIGYGAFGPSHLLAWYRLGFAEQLYLADPDPTARARCRAMNLPVARLAADFQDFLPAVDIVDIVTPHDSHAELAAAALRAGKHVFLEKPATATLAAAQRLEKLSAQTGRVLQVGYYFRGHPLTKQALELRAGLGELRYLSGDFSGFKRARNDSGVAENDASHFLDLANLYAGGLPREVFAAARDHFGRGLDDLLLALLTYPDGTLAKIEAGYIQPGATADSVVPGALSNKVFTIVGAQGTLEIDYQRGRLTHHAVRHECMDGVWWPRFSGSNVYYAAEAVDPVAILVRQFRALLASIETGAPPLAGISEAGVDMARLLAAIAESARCNRPVRLQEMEH